MSNYSIVQKSIRKVKQSLVPLLSTYRRNKLSNTDFSIISNNCWGGLCYEFFGLPKLSPTVGCYFFPEDYIRFAKKLPYYLKQEIEMISAQNSIHVEELKKKKQMEIPVGRIDDVEIVFLHYHDSNTAKEKWIRRCKRVNWDNLVFKFSFMGDSCTTEHVKEFETIDAGKSFFFAPNIPFAYSNVIYVPENDLGFVDNDTFYWNKYIDVYKLINTGEIVQRNNPYKR